MERCFDSYFALLPINKMAFQTPQDVAVQVVVPNENNPSGTPLLSSERRITPSWTISHLKTKLEPITGIPAQSQSLRTKSLSGTWIILNNPDILLSDPSIALRKGSVIEVSDPRPGHERTTFNPLTADLSSVEKYRMPESQYEKLEDSVLAWKRRQKLGRFDPDVKTHGQVARERREKDEREMKRRGIVVGMRCRVNHDDERRGTVRFTGEVEGLGGQREEGCLWVGIELDEPVGRNNGSVVVEIEGEDGKVEKNTKRLFQCGEKYGVLSRPEKVEVGDFPVMDDLMDEDMEEL
jgi:tubulin-specific chaperone B